MNAIAPKGDLSKIGRAQFGILFRIADTSRRGLVSWEDFIVFETLLKRPDADYWMAFQYFDVYVVSSFIGGSFAVLKRLYLPLAAHAPDTPLTPRLLLLIARLAMSVLVTTPETSITTSSRLSFLLISARTRYPLTLIGEFSCYQASLGFAPVR